MASGQTNIVTEPETQRGPVFSVPTTAAGCWAFFVFERVIITPDKPLRPCSKPGCSELTTGGYCEGHRKHREAYRGSAHERGYTYVWQKYSKRFLRRPENALCKLELEGCTMAAECVDHIDPPDSPKDPRFWQPENHQSACIHCNSVKGRKKIVGTGGVRL